MCTALQTESAMSYSIILCTVVGAIVQGLLQSGGCTAVTVDAFRTIRAEDFNVSSRAVKESYCGFPQVGGLGNGAMLGYYNVDFGQQGPKAIHLRISNGSRRSRIPFTAKLYLNQPSGKAFATFNVQPIGGWCDYIEWKVFLAEVPTNIHHLFFVFSADPAAGFAVFNLDWFIFTNDL